MVRELDDGERVRMAHHHVVWLPGPASELKVIQRILEMLRSMPASRVAARLTAEGVPTPDFYRSRTDRGVRHRTSGIWNTTTIINIARNPLLLAMTSFGRRSMGDQLRFSSSGPRALDENVDYRTDEKPKVIRNAAEDVVTGRAHFEPLVGAEEHRDLVDILDRRAGSQRGKPRSRNPEMNPLGTRVFDLNCCWPMYRAPSKSSFGYRCGLYVQSYGKQCDHNTVDGPTATRFVLNCIREHLKTPKFRSRLEQRLRQLAQREHDFSTHAKNDASKAAELAQLTQQLHRVSENLALAPNDEQFQAMSRVFDQLQAQRHQLEIQLAKAPPAMEFNIDVEVSKALSAVDRLVELIDGPAGLATASQIIQLMNARLYLRFGKVRPKKRVVNQVQSGMLVFGAAPAPITVYGGPTGRRGLKSDSAATVAAGTGDKKTLPNLIVSGREGKSLRNVNRGDRI